MRINVYKREGKRGVRWYLDYFWGGQRCRYPVADTRGVAEEIRARIQVQVADGTFKGPQAIEEARKNGDRAGRSARRQSSVTYKALLKRY